MAADAPSALLPEETLEAPAARRYPPGERPEWPPREEPEQTQREGPKFYKARTKGPWQARDRDRHELCLSYAYSGFHPIGRPTPQDVAKSRARQALWEVSQLRPHDPRGHLTV